MRCSALLWHLHAMQAFRGLAKTLIAVERRACYASQLPHFSNRHAESVATSEIRNAARAGAGLSRPFAAMPLSTDKQRVVILGTGWAAARLAKDLNCNYFDITVSSTSEACVTIIRDMQASVKQFFIYCLLSECGCLARLCRLGTTWYSHLCWLRLVWGHWSFGAWLFQSCHCKSTSKSLRTSTIWHQLKMWTQKRRLLRARMKVA